MTATFPAGSPVRRLARGSSAFVLSNVARAFLGFAMSLVIAHGLGHVRFGRWTFCMAWASGLTMICDLGLNVLLTREAARPGSHGGQLLVAALAAKLLLLAPLGAAVVIAAPSLGIDAESSVALRVGVFLAAGGAAYGCLAAVFRGFEWLFSIACLETGGLALQSLGSLWILRAGGGVVDLVWLATAIQVAQLALAASLWRIRGWPRGRVAGRSWRRAAVLIRRSLPFAAAGLLATLQARSSPLMLGYLRTAVDVGWFGAAWRFGEMAKLIPHAIFGAAFPVFSNETWKEDSRVEHLLRTFDRALFALALLAAGALITGAHPILRWTYGAEFLPAVPTLLWVAIGLVPALTNSGRKVYLYATGDEGYAVRLSLIGVVIQLVASVPLIPAYGASGAAMSIALGEAAVWLPLRKRLKSRGQRGHLPTEVCMSSTPEPF